jgi:hypothetical protein
VAGRVLQEEQVYRSKVFQKPSETQAVFMFDQSEAGEHRPVEQESDAVG